MEDARLSNIVEHSDLLSDNDLVTFAEQVYRLTVDLHKTGIAHRDIKPSNIVLSDVDRRLPSNRLWYLDDFAK